MGIIRYADAFCGLGGFSVAMKQVHPSAECVWAIDFDKKVAEVFKNNHGMSCHGDIKTTDISAIPDHDILFGGFPCQPFSRGGKWSRNKASKIGKEDTRGMLFIQLTNILRIKQPKFFIFENVPRLEKMKDSNNLSCYEVILGHFIYAGYKVRTEKLNAADFGLPQSRERLFFLGIREDLSDELELINKQPRTSCIKDILEDIVSDKYKLSNTWKNRKLLDLNPSKKNHTKSAGDSRLDALYEIYGKTDKSKNKTFKPECVAELKGDTPSGISRQSDRVYSTLGISPTLITSGPPIIDVDTFRALTPRECARLQGLPDSFILYDNDTLAYKHVGNSVAIPVIVALIKSLLLKEDK
jgi:DNA (cytosine-5)-methyltransferase 1